MYSQRALDYAKVFVAGDIVTSDKIEHVAENIQIIMSSIHDEAIELAAKTCEIAPGGNREIVANAIRGLKSPQ